MTLSEEVVLDLLPVYLAGEASAETTRIVEDFLEHNPKLAALARNEKAKLPLAPAPRADEEIRSIERTRAIVRRRSWLRFGASRPAISS